MIACRLCADNEYSLLHLFVVRSTGLVCATETRRAKYQEELMPRKDPNRAPADQPKEAASTTQLSLDLDRPPAPAGLRLFTSNQLEVLAAGLAQFAQLPPSSPFAQEVVVVQSQGMARWLKLELAQSHGICANYDFPFPKAFAHRVFGALLPDLPDASPFEREVMVWKILEVLPELLGQAHFASLARYLSGLSDPRKQIQLAARIAYLFDQYLIFRPELVLAWDAGEEADDWQAILWRRVARDLPPPHPAALAREFAQRIRGSALPQGELPERLSIFGISALPPFYLELFAGLARHIPVHLFVLEPSREYWGEIVCERRRESILRRLGKSGAAAEDLHLERGNRLLASFGRLGQDFLNLIYDSAELIDDQQFVDPGDDTLLHGLQSDILDLRDRGQGELPTTSVPPTDRSIQVHSCHSPLRELEVLQDHLLAWFDADPELAPRDILVMTPDIETYAPLVQAVFGTEQEEALRIPVSVADRSARRQSQVIETFLSLLHLPESRFGVASVLDLLETPALREQFGLVESDLDLIRIWAEETRIRWGMDAQHRASLDLPGSPDNTWRQGLDRLLLGYAMAGRQERTFQGLIPSDQIEGGNAAVLGHFLEWIERLAATAKSLRIERRLQDWGSLLNQILNDFFLAGPETENDLQTIRDAVAALLDQGRRAGFDQPVALTCVLEQLEPALAEDRFGSGFLTGSVTFCALKPMRSIPFKIICLLGMNDDAFPRATSQLSFDRMTAHPREGDRSSREDDRYLFLETLLSARQRLYISYLGQSIRDNSPAPPSVAVSELLDYLEQGFVLEDGNILSDLVVTQHRLQAFSEAYFSGASPRLFSYSSENCAASQRQRAARARPAPFLEEPLPPPAEEWRTIDLHTLAEFFCHPAKILATKRLKILLPEDRSALEEREVFALQGLEEYALKEWLVDLRLRGHDRASAERLVQASAHLPLGDVGQAQYQSLWREVEAFVKRLAPHQAAGFLEPRNIDVSIDDFRVIGRLDRITPTGLLHFRCTKIKAKDQIRAWIKHLVWNTLNPAAGTTVLIGNDRMERYQPVDQPSALLRKLLQLYWVGLTRPLRFFPVTSHAYAEAELSAKDAWAQARQAWEGKEFAGLPGEKNDPYIALFFRNLDPLDDEFRDQALTVFQPLLKHRQDLTP